MENFFKKYIEQGLNYPVFDIEKHAKDIYSLWNSLQNPLFREDFADYIKKLKQYAVGELSLLNDQVLFNPVNQAPNFLTLNFGSVEANKNFVDFAKRILIYFFIKSHF